VRPACGGRAFSARAASVLALVESRSDRFYRRPRRRALRVALIAFRLATAERLRLRDTDAANGIGLGRAWRGW
jgi:hypothetical protein